MGVGFVALGGEAIGSASGAGVVSTGAGVGALNVGPGAVFEAARLDPEAVTLELVVGSPSVASVQASSKSDKRTGERRSDMRFVLSGEVRE
jgi:hypothetical protein